MKYNKGDINELAKTLIWILVFALLVGALYFLLRHFGLIG